MFEVVLPAKEIDNHVSDPSQFPAFLNDSRDENQRPLDRVELGPGLDHFAGKLVAQSSLNALLVNPVRREEAAHHVLHARHQRFERGHRLSDAGKLGVRVSRAEDVEQQQNLPVHLESLSAHLRSDKMASDFSRL